MFFAAGVGAYQAAMFHLFTHAFFKALLFLGAGSVIHGMHHEQDMRQMGGPGQAAAGDLCAMTIGTIAITGLGFPPLRPGLRRLLLEGHHHRGGPSPAASQSASAMFAWVIGVLVAGLTSFYSWRLAFMTFNGKARWGHDDRHAHDAHAAHGHDDHAHAAESHDEPLADDHAHDDHGHGHDHKPHESPWVMLFPLLRAVDRRGGGRLRLRRLLRGSPPAGVLARRDLQRPDQPRAARARPPSAPTWVKWSPLVASIIGLLIACLRLPAERATSGRAIAAAQGPAVDVFFYNKWFFDELYQATFVRLAKFLGDLFWKGGDQKLIDGFDPTASAPSATPSAVGPAELQSGYLYHYAFVMLLGVAGLLAYALFRFH